MAALLLAAAVTGSGAAPLAAAPDSRPQPLAGMRFYVDPFSDAARQAAAWAPTRRADALALRKIASQPQADWFGDWAGDVRSAVGARTSVVRAAGATPLFVAYNIPLRDCGQHSSGGAPSAAAYRTWIRQFAAGLGAGASVVILEPDAVAASGCLSEARREERLALLGDAVEVLKSRPGTLVYLDAGHPRWHAPADIAALLRRAGVGSADGFALNVSNTVHSGENVRYGQEVSRLLGGARFVVDTSRSGRGGGRAEAWCNPPDRALGEAPTTRTGHALADAFLWIKRPGESDGTCNGGPPVGEWWPSYALELARRSP